MGLSSKTIGSSESNHPGVHRCAKRATKGPFGRGERSANRTRDTCNPKKSRSGQGIERRTDPNKYGGRHSSYWVNRGETRFGGSSSKFGSSMGGKEGNIPDGNGRSGTIEADSSFGIPTGQASGESRASEMDDGTPKSRGHPESCSRRSKA